MKMSDILNFSIMSDHIITSSGNFYLYKITPPNLTILTFTEKLLKISDFQSLLNGLDFDMQILVIDKTEDFNANRIFCEKINPKYDYISNAILSEINNNNNQKTSIQRGFYFVIRPKDDIQKSTFETLLKTNDFKFSLSNKFELITVTRNILLREFIDTDIYSLESEVIESFYEK